MNKTVRPTFNCICAGLDVGDQATAVCVTTGNGPPLLEVEAESTPAGLYNALKPYRAVLYRVGHEAGTLSPWLHKELLKKRLPVVCLDPRKTRAALNAQRNKTDRNDARGIATLLAQGFEATVFVKSDEAHRMRMLLAQRSVLRRKARDVEGALRSAVKVFGARLEKKGRTLTLKYFDRRRDPILADVGAAMIRAWQALHNEADGIEARIKQLTRDDPICRRFMTVPGVGPLTALAFKACIDDPSRFVTSRAVGAYLGLTPRAFQSGQISRPGRISRFGDEGLRTLLYEGASVMLTHSKTKSALKTWGMAIAARRGKRVANVACARKLAVILHRLWITGENFDPAR